VHAAVKDRCCILGLDWYSHHVNLDTSIVASLVRLRVIISPRLSTEHSILSRWGSFVATVETVQCHSTVPVHVSQGEGFGDRRRSCKGYVDVVCPVVEAQCSRLSSPESDAGAKNQDIHTIETQLRARKRRQISRFQDSFAHPEPLGNRRGDYMMVNACSIIY